MECLTTLNCMVSDEAGVARSLTFPETISASNVASEALPVYIVPYSVIDGVVPS